MPANAVPHCELHHARGHDRRPAHLGAHSSRLAGANGPCVDPGFRGKVPSKLRWWSSVESCVASSGRRRGSPLSDGHEILSLVDEAACHAAGRCRVFQDAAINISGMRVALSKASMLFASGAPRWLLWLMLNSALF